MYNAKLYPWINFIDDAPDEEYKLCFLDLDNFKVEAWRKSLRFSLEDISKLIDMEDLFNRRCWISNIINVTVFIDSIVKNKYFDYNSMIKKLISDGYTEQLLCALDHGLFLLFLLIFLLVDEQLNSSKIYQTFKFDEFYMNFPKSSQEKAWLKQLFCHFESAILSSNDFGKLKLIICVKYVEIIIVFV